MSTENTNETPPVDRGDEIRSPLDIAEDVKQPDSGEDTEGAEDREQDTDALDETEEEKAERERIEAEETRKRNIRIPKSRLDEAQAKARQREEQLLAKIEQLESSQRTTTVQQNVIDAKNKINDMQDKYEDLILDGKKDEARKVRKQIDQMRDELIEFQTTAKSDAAKNSAIEELSYNAQLAHFESTYPELNPDTDAFDDAVVDEVVTLRDAFIRSGSNRVDSLNKAVRYVLGTPPQQKVAEAAKTLAEERNKRAREKAAEANNKQPPSIARIGVDSDKAGTNAQNAGVDIMRLSQDKFAKLDEDTKAKLRGDDV